MEPPVSDPETKDPQTESQTPSKSESASETPAAPAADKAPDAAPAEPPGPVGRVMAQVRRALASVFGSVSYSPPGWMRGTGGKLSNAFWFTYEHPARVVMSTLVLFLTVFGGYQGYVWYQNRPKPVEMSVRLIVPDAPKLTEGSDPDTLGVSFGGSAAPLDKIKKEISRGVEIEPRIPGTWTWSSDRLLLFHPKEHWPIGEKFVVTLDKKNLLDDKVRLKDYELTFTAPEFTATVSHTEFYQDPQDPSLRKVVATISFSHAVNPQEFEKHLSLELTAKKEGQAKTQPYQFQVTYDKYRASAFVHSAPVAIPEHDSQMKIRVSGGIHAQAGGKPFTKDLVESVTIPGLYDFLRVSESSLTLVNNAQYEPEQVLLVEMNTGVTEAEMKKSVSAYVLPLRPLTDQTDNKEPYSWSAYEVTPEVLKKSAALRLDQIPNEKDYAETHSFKYQAEVGRYVYVQVKRGLKSYGGFVLDKTFDATLHVPEFPKELKVLQNGALLSLSGEKKVSLYARDIDAVKFEVGRVLPGQLHHLVSQSSGRFQHPEFYSSYRFDVDNISELFESVQTLPKVAHGKAQYTSFDLSKYLEGKGEDRRGLFFLKAESYDPDKKITTGKTDQRLILITDLGMLVKDNADGTQDVFVQSIATGEPVSKVKVAVIGKNGEAILTETTDGDGHVSFPKLKDFTREKSPLLYLVRKGNDMSFLPYGKSDRYLDFSRFQVEGVTDDQKPQGLSAYLFSDRGIYRPGDEIRVGLIVKPRDWKQSLAGVPLEITVDDARGVTVKRDKIKLTESGFEEIRYTTLDASPTGTWNVNVHVVKDGKADSLLGSVAVRVQEFLPDRLKISARLSADSNEGWVSPVDLKARVTLLNLFGTPATERRVKATLQLSPTFPSFSKFRDYQFSDPMHAKEAQFESLPDGETNDKGEAEFDLNLQRFASATYKLRFVAQGYEAEGGRSVAAEASVIVSPLAYLVGYKADGDLHYVTRGTRRIVDLIAVGPQGNRVAASGIRAMLMERRYLSVLTKQYNGTYKYESLKKEIPISDKQIEIPQQGLGYALASDKPGDYVLLLKNEKDQELSRVEWSVAGTANVSRSLDKNAELQVTLKNPDVAAGEDLEMQIKAPYTGAGLITIERDKVVSYKWFKTTTTASVQSIRVPEGMEGNGYVTVAFIRGLDSNEVFMSPLSYGVVPFSLSKERRTAKIALSTPDLVKPGEAFRMKYSVDRPAKIVVWAVDEGILQVANYKTPEPLAYFFQKKALEVKTAQILDLVLPEFSRVMAAAPGGDGEGGGDRNLNPFKRRRDKPVAFWSGIIDADKREREVVYQIPDSFNGKLRVMAVAVAPDAVGVFHKNATVRGDFVLSPNVPTFAAPGDQFDVSVGVANNVVGSGKDAPVSVELKTSKHLQVVGQSKVTLKLGEMRETVTVFSLKATGTLGSGSLTFVASLGNKSGKYTTDMSVRPAVPLLTTTQVGHWKGGKQVVSVPRRMYGEFRVLQAGLSPLPLGLAHGLSKYLEKYPHGCTEQIVSQGMPAIVLKGRPEFAIDPAAAELSFATVVSTLRARQNEDGGFGLWGNVHYVSDFASTYATHFLIEAKERGFAVPPELLKQSLSYLGQIAGRETDSLAGERLRAYATYVLTRSGMVTSTYAGSVQKTLENAFKSTWKKDLAAVYLAATYKLLKQDKVADKIIAELKLGQLGDKDADYLNFYDPLIRDAQLLFVLARHFPERIPQLGGDALLALVDPISKERYSTLSSSYTILALESLAQVATTTDIGQLGIAEVADGGQQKPLTLPAGLFPLVGFSPEASKLVMSSTGPLRAFYQVTQSGFDLTPPSKEIKQKLEVFREFIGDGGKATDKAKLGDEIEVHVRVRSTTGAPLYNVAILDLLPGGFEVVIQQTPSSEDEEEKEDKTEDGGEGGDRGEGEGDGEGGGDEGGGGDESPAEHTPSAGGAGTTPPPASLPIAVDASTWQPIYGDVREDRVVLYGTVDKDAAEFIYTIKATNVGTYVVPPLQAEGMYDRTVLARSLGGKISVVK